MRLTRLPWALLASLYAAGLLPAAPAPQAAKAPFRTLHYEQQITMTGGNQQRNQRLVKVFVKAGKVRMESPEATLVSDGKHAYACLAASKQAFAMPLQAVAVMDGTWESLKRGLPGGARRVGTGKAGGYQCDIYVTTAAEAKGKRTTAKVWVYPRLNLPVRSEVTMPGGKMLVETRNVRVDEPLADSLFTLPTGFTVIKPSQKPAGRQTK